MDDLSHTYQVLGIKPGTTPDEAKRIYRDLVQVWHPDRFSHDERLRLVAQEKLKEINGAYKILEAHFFDASTQPKLPTPETPPPAAEPKTTASPPVAPRKKTGLVVTLAVVIVLSAVAGAMFLKSKKTGEPSASDVPPLVAETPPATNQLPKLGRYAVSFGKQSRIELATTGALTGTYTVECWALTRRPAQNGTVISSLGPKDFTFDIKFRQGKRFHGDVGDGARWLLKGANATFSYQKDIWCHVAYVVTPTSCTSYVNGKNTRTTPISPRANPMLYDHDHKLTLGIDSLGGDPLDGCVAEVRVWRTARSAEEIKTSMSSPLNGDEYGLEGYWPFKEGLGTNSVDASGHGFTAHFVGNVSWSTNVPPDFAR